MKINSKYLLLLVSMLSSWLFISGCNKTIDTTSEKITLYKGSVTREENGNHANYNLTEGKYNKLETEKVIVAYDILSGNCVYEKNGKLYVQSEEDSIEIVDKDIINPKLSPGGKYISYFKRDKYMELVIKRLKDNKEIEIKTNVAISGSLMDWNTEKSLVYYGVDENKNNAIFSYNIESGKEEIIYKLENGYLEFIKAFKDGLIFVQESVGGVKSLKSIDGDNNVKLLTEEIDVLKDIIITDQGTYFLGKMKNNNESIYEVKQNSIERVIYDFPSIIHLEKGLSYDENGNILFIGGTDSFEKEKIYTYDNGYIKSLTNEDVKYYFVDVK